MCPIFDGCEDAAVGILCIQCLTKGMKERQITYWLHLLII
jgi:hypothetical protein